MTFPNAVTDIGKTKQRARFVQDRLRRLGHAAPLTHAYEILATSLGYRNWPTMRSSLTSRGSIPEIGSMPYWVLPCGWSLLLSEGVKRTGSPFLYLSVADADGGFRGEIAIGETTRGIYGISEGAGLGSGGTRSVIGEISREFLLAIAPFVADNRYSFAMPVYALGWVVDENGIPYRPDEIPTGIRISGDLDLSYSGVTRLPGDMRVAGWLRVTSTLERLPRGLQVGTLDLWLAERPLLDSMPSCLEVRNHVVVHSLDDWPES